MATIKAIEYWTMNSNLKGGDYAVRLPGGGERETVDQLTGEWESVNADTQRCAIAIDLPDGWRLIETLMGEGALETEEGEVILSRELFITGEGEITAYGGHGGGPRSYRMKFKAWEG